MLRRAENCRLGYSKGIFGKGRLSFYIGKTKSYSLGKLRRDEVARIAQGQQDYPFRVLRTEGRTYWQFRGRFYWDNDGLNSDQVYALLVTRLQREQATIERAQAMVATGMRPSQTGRGSIPDDIKQLVWLRDGGSCRSCGTTSDLQFDHVIPLSLGGSSERDNLQILCGPCNRAKGAGLTTATPTPASFLPPAGWYEDPHGEAPLRYWDGARWTSHISGVNPQ